MPRVTRLHAPGSPFHVTALTQNGTAWFAAELRDHIAEYICEAAATSSVRLLAYAVMPNHLHVVARQGVQPLGWMMQRVLLRTALLVRRTYRHRGHVFARRFWSGMCYDAAYLRQAIIYTHLNPFYAGLCRHPRDYAWTSHGCYEGRPTQRPGDKHVCVENGRPLFAARSFEERHVRTNYMRFIDYWMHREKLPLGVKYILPEQQKNTAPQAQSGDMYWTAEYGDVAAPPQYPHNATDLRDRAVAALRTITKDLTLEELRLGGRRKAICVVRNRVIATLLTAGYRNAAIARCLNVSAGLVSAVNADLRAAALKSVADSRSGRS